MKKRGSMVLGIGAHVRRRNYFPLIITAIFVFGFVASLISTLTTSAAANIFKIQNVEQTGISASAEGTITGFDEQTISSGVVFHRLNDYVEYTITLKNTDTSAHIIETITDDNSNPYIIYDYLNHQNEQINAGSDLVFVVTARYTNQANMNDRVSVNNVKFNIKFLDIEEDDEIIVVPDTGANTSASGGVSFSTISLIVSALGLILICVLVMKKQKKISRVIVALIICISAITFAATVKAEEASVNGFTFTTGFAFKDRLIVTYKDANNSEHHEVINYGSLLNLENPVKNGYRFAGWKYADGSVFVASDPITDDISIVPVFTLDTYNISYDLAGGTTSEPNTTAYTVNDTVTLNEPTKAYYNFAGWTGTDLTEPTKNVVIPSGSTGDRSYTATYTPIDYDITYSNITSEELASLSVPSTYNIETASFTIGKPATRVDGDGDPTYTFVGWKEGGTISETVTLPDVNSMGPKTYEAQWVPVDATTYTISYELNGGTTATPNRTTFTKNDETFSIINPTKTGYTFKGWSGTDLVGDSNTNVQVVQGTRKSLSFEAHYTANTYKVIFDANNGSGSMADQTLTYDTAANLTTNIYTRFGYSFNGWNTEAGGTGTSYTDGASVINLRTEGEITLYAQWTANNYSIAFDCNRTGCEGTMENYPMVYDTEKALPLNAFSVSGYTFAGWNTKPTGDGDNYGNGASVNNLAAVGTITLYAKWTATPQNITYILDGGTANNPATYTIEESVTLNNPTREGYNFTGWSGTGLEGEENMEVIIPVGSIGERVYTAHWSPINYTITYVGLEYMTEEEFAALHVPTSYNVESAFTLNMPEKTGYQFDGWSGTGLDAPQLIVTITAGATGDLTFEANFTPNKFVVIFDPNPGVHVIGGSMDSQEFTYDVEQALTKNAFTVSETGIKYGGWNTEADGSGTHYDDEEVVSNLNPNNHGSITLYAEWGKTPYTVTFDKNAEDATGEDPEDIIIEYGEYFNLPGKTYRRNGYAAIGWNTKSDGTGTHYDFSQRVINLDIDGEITLYAEWVESTAVLMNHGPNSGINKYMKALVGNAGDTPTHSNNTIKHFKRSQIEPSDEIKNGKWNKVSASDSNLPVYIWFDEATGTINWWSEAETVYLPEHAEYMFATLRALEDADIEEFDTTRAVNMTGMFNGNDSLRSIDLSNFDTDGVTDMHNMFAGCKSLTSLNVSTLDTKDVTDMSNMFAGVLIDALDVTGFSTANVKKFSGMFSGMKNLTSLDVSGFVTDNATHMNAMFKDCESLTTIDVSEFNTANVTTFEEMFKDCKSVTELDVSGFVTSSATSIGGMFYNCNNITELELTGFNTESVTNMNHVFYGMTNITVLDLSSFKTSQVTGMQYLFAGDVNLKTIYVTEAFTLDSISGASAQLIFDRCTKIVGGLGTTWHSRDQQYAHIDGGPENPGYFTDKNKLNIFFNANGGVGTMEGQTNLPANTDVTLNPNQFSINEVGRVFGGWNTEPDGSGIHYDNGGTINAYGRVLLYAQWGATPYTVIFDKNAPTGITISGAMENISKEYGERFNLPANQYSTNGYAFLGWNTKADGKGKHYDNEQEVVNLDIDGEVTLYAEWKEMTALFDTGTNVRNTIASLVTSGHTIRKIKESATAPDLNSVTYKLLSLKDSYYPIYAWYDETTETIYYWSESEKMYLNSNSAAMFQSLLDVTEIDTTNFDTSRVTTMHGMFGRLQSLMYNEGDKKLTHLDLSNWDTSNVTDMRYMFYGCNSLESITLGDGWDTSNVTNMASMFQGNNALGELDTANWNTEKVTDMSNMFSGCSSLTSLDVADWKTGEVTTMSNMFAGCSSLSALNVNSWDTGKVTTMYNMFADCQSLTSLDLSRWSTENVTNMAQMFQGCSGLTTLDVSRFNTEKVTNMSGMFGGTQYKKGCESLTSLNLSSFNTGAVTNMSNMFRGMSALMSLNLSNFNTELVTDMSGLFQGMTSLSDLNISSFNTSSATTLAGMFANTKSLAAIDITHFNTRKVKSIANMFQGSIITELDLTNFDTTNLTGHAGFVYDAVNLKTIYVTENSDFTKASGYAPYYNTKLVGGANTPYEYYFSLKPEAGRIDDPDNGKRGLFTLKDSRYIRYNGNGADNSEYETMTSHYLTNTGSLKANAFVKSGFVFGGWNTVADGSGVDYTDGQVMSDLTESKTPLTLYAMWLSPNGFNGTVDLTPQYSTANVLQKSSTMSQGYVGAAYFDPSDFSKRCNANSTNVADKEAKTGCMKWYIYDDSGDSYKMILDHNTTKMITFNSSNNNSNPQALYDRLDADTADWDKTKLSTGILTAADVAAISGINSFNSANSTYYSLGTEVNSSNGKGRSAFGWLYDYTRECETHGCDHEVSTGYGHWTTTPVSGNKKTVWLINYFGRLTFTEASLGNWGIRPIVTVSKSVVSGV